MRSMGFEGKELQLGAFRWRDAVPKSLLSVLYCNQETYAFEKTGHRVKDSKQTEISK